MLKYVVKRDGRIDDFESKKIKLAILNGLIVTYKDRKLDALRKLSEVICDKVIYNLSHITFVNENPTIEEIQDVVEDTLIEMGEKHTAKQYILYRFKHKNIRDGKHSLIDSEKIISEYVNQHDWKVKENSNMGFSLQGLNNHLISEVTRSFWLNKIYSEPIGKAHSEGALHIHDLGLLSTYCCGWSLEDLLLKGFGGVAGKIESNPAKHLKSALGQLVNFFYTLQGEAAGAQAFSSFDTYIAPFVRFDNLDYGQVRQTMQEFIFNLNVPTRVGFQTPFVNLTMDLQCPSTIANTPVIIGGKYVDGYTYKDFQPEMDMLNSAFCEIMMEGDAKGRIFTFPIPTYNITKDFDWNRPVIDKVIEMTSKYGIPYFANFVNSDMSPDDARSMCPLTGDTKVLVKSKQNGTRVSTIIDIINNMNVKNTKYEVWTQNGWKKANPIKIPMTDVYEITLSNGATVKMGENHLQPIMGDHVIPAKALEENMWLPFNKKPLGTNLGSKELGFAIGAYLGDGSIDNKAIIYSLDIAEKDNETEKRLRDFWEHTMGFIVKTTVSDKNVRFVRVNGNPIDIVIRYVNGENALTKCLTRNTFNSSTQFKQGLIEGMAATDGSRAKKRLYTSSPKLREDLAILLSSMGQKYMINYVDQREGRLGTNPNYRIDYPNRINYGDYFKEDENYHYYRIVSKKRINVQGENLYCFEVDTEDHLFMLANGLITHNCRLRLDNRELRKRGGGLFGANPLTGSIGVVTINLPRLGYLHKTEEDYFENLRRLMDLAKYSLETKRKVIEKNTLTGLYPYSKHYLEVVYARFNAYWKNHFSTIGLCGMNECILNFYNGKEDITTKTGQAFSNKVLDFMREIIIDYQVETDNLYNLEATPAEGTGYRLAKLDLKKYPNIITAGIDDPYYTNSTQLPVNFTSDIFEALDLQEDLQCKYTGGTVFHSFLGEKIDDIETCKSLIKKVMTNYKIPYFTISPTFSVCPDHGYIAGEYFNCPQCNKDTEVWSRVVGFYRPVNNWNKGKRSEFEDRKEFVI